MSSHESNKSQSLICRSGWGKVFLIFEAFNRMSSPDASKVKGLQTIVQPHHHRNLSQEEFKNKLQVRAPSYPAVLYNK